MSDFQQEDFCPNCKARTTMTWFDMGGDGYQVNCTECKYYAWESCWERDVLNVKKQKETSGE